MQVEYMAMNDLTGRLEELIDRLQTILDNSNDPDIKVALDYNSRYVNQFTLDHDVYFAFISDE